MKMNPYVLADMTWMEVEEALKTVRVAIIPTGSNEQHGPHMTMRTDIANSTAMALRIAQRLGSKAIVAPSLPFGISPHHMKFPGSITLRPEIFLAVLEDVITSLKIHGIKNFFILNGHGGNAASLGQLMHTIKRDLGVEAAFTQVFPSRDVRKEYAATPTHGHSCDLEASWSLYLAPEVVHKDRLTPGKTKDRVYRHVPNPITVSEGFDELTENGALGDATKASYETGEALIAPMIDSCVEFLEDFIARDGS